MEKLLFCTDTDSGTISVLDVDRVQKRQDDALRAAIPVGNGPRGPVKFTQIGRGFVANHAGDTISEIDAHSLRETGRIQVGIAPIGVCILPGDRFVLTSLAGENVIAIVDICERRVVGRVATGREPRHMDALPDGSAVLVAISGSDYVGVIDTRALCARSPAFDGAMVKEVGRVYLGEGTMPYSVAVSPDGRKALAANNQSDFVSVIDVERRSVHATVDVGTKGARGSVFSADSRSVFVTLEDTSEIVLIDSDKGRLVLRFPTGPGPRGIILDADSGTVYASAFARNKASVKTFRPNSVSILDFGPKGVRPGGKGASPHSGDVLVGAGPCSVSMFQRE